MNYNSENLNKCDKCGVVMDSEDLIWITAEDFTPYEVEIVPKELYKNYDALCEDCYLKCIKFKKGIK